MEEPIQIHVPLQQALTKKDGILPNPFKLEHLIAFSAPKDASIQQFYSDSEFCLNMNENHSTDFGLAYYSNKISVISCVC